LIKSGHLIWLFTCILGGALIGPMSNVVDAEGIWLKLVWRYSPVIIGLNLLMLGKVIYDCKNKNTSKNKSLL